MAVVDSSSAGYLRPLAPDPTYDADLEDIFQALCVGITGLAGQHVRPRWQVNPGNLPNQQENWAAYGLAVEKADWNAFESHDPNAADGAGTSSVQRSELITCNFSFYGPNCQLYMGMLRDGMSVAQNRDVLANKGIKFQEFAEPVNLPFLLKDTWNRRVDLRGIFSRWTTRTYGIRNLASADGTIDNERYVTSFATTPPTP